MPFRWTNFSRGTQQELARAAGLRFAIPAESVRSIVPELVAHGCVERPKLGVGVELVERTVPVEIEREGRTVTVEMTLGTQEHALPPRSATRGR